MMNQEETIAMLENKERHLHQQLVEAKAENKRMKRQNVRMLNIMEDFVYAPDNVVLRCRVCGRTIDNGTHHTSCMLGKIFEKLKELESEG